MPELIIPDFPTEYENARRAALYKLISFFIARMEGKIGDILLTNECRLKGLIDDYTDKFFDPKEERFKYKKGKS